MGSTVNHDIFDIHKYEVAAWVSDKLVCTRRYDLEQPDIEIMWLDVRLRNNYFLLCIAYRPPNKSDVFWEALQEMINNINSSAVRHIILMGDFNADDRTGDGTKLHYLLEINHLTSLINEPTRITQTSRSVLDRIITNNPLVMKNPRILRPLCHNDHCTIEISCLFRIEKCSVYKRIMWDYSRADFIGLNEYLSGIDWNNEYGDFEDIDVAANKFNDILLNAANRFIPNKEVVVRPNDKPWYNSDLRR